MKSEFVDVCLQNYPIWPDICVFTQTRNRINVMCARRDIVNLIVWNTTCALNMSSLMVLVYIYTRTFASHTERIKRIFFPALKLTNSSSLFSLSPTKSFSFWKEEKRKKSKNSELGVPGDILLKHNQQNSSSTATSSLRDHTRLASKKMWWCASQRLFGRLSFCRHRRYGPRFPVGWIWCRRANRKRHAVSWSVT